MPWLKLLHISAVIVWCGALLYLPLALAAARGGHTLLAERGGPPLLRGLFTSVATPAALLAIGSGSLIFLLHGPLLPWLVAKLLLVSLLVLGHAACGLLILRDEHRAAAGQTAPQPVLVCVAITATSLLWLLGIAWLVLRKPLW